MATIAKADERTDVLRKTGADTVLFVILLSICSWSNFNIIAEGNVENHTIEATSQTSPASAALLMVPTAAASSPPSPDFNFTGHRKRKFLPSPPPDVTSSRMYTTKSEIPGRMNTSPVPKNPRNFNGEASSGSGFTRSFINPELFPSILDDRYDIDPSISIQETLIKVTGLVCGNSYFCNDSLKTFSPSGFCFNCEFSCSCDEICRYYGDCCVDYLITDMMEDAEHSEVQPEVVCYKVGTFSAFMLSGCPEGSNENKVIVDKCESPDDSDISQATPVSSVETQVTYRNIYCARCHGIVNYGIWKHEIECEDDVPLHEATTEEQLWELAHHAEGCDVSTFPPPDITLRMCESEAISSCINDMGMEPYLCDLVYSPIGYNGKTYRNVFCSMCNGAVLKKDDHCSHPSIPTVVPRKIRPLNVLINFDPKELGVQITTEQTGREICDIGKVKDPFSGECLPLQCSVRRLLIRQKCEVMFSSIKGLGFSLSYTMTPSSEVRQWSTLTTEYEVLLRKLLKPYQPHYFQRLVFYVLIKQDNVTSIEYFAGMIVTVEILFMTDRTYTDMEKALRKIQSRDWLFRGQEIPIVINTSPNLCSETADIAFDYVHEEFVRDSYVKIDHECDEDCRAKLEYLRVYPKLECPFVELNFRRYESKFAFFVDNSTLRYRNFNIILKESSYQFCKESIKICSEVLSHIAGQVTQPEVPTPPEKELFVPEVNVVMTIVSTVFISLSLAFLLLTFLIYCLLPQLRILPGKNNMAVTLHIFCAQVLFLSGIGATGSVTICRTMGILIHYFWMSSFVWVAMCAYHMYTIFLNLLQKRNNPTDERSLFIRNIFIADGSPWIVILVCLLYHLANSRGQEIGYGGAICFLDKPGDIGLYFAAPVGMTLASNIYHFMQTFICIRKIPDMEEASNKSNKTLVVVYFKLSILLGLTWIFGFIAATIHSDEVWYIFIVLTGTQGAFIYLLFCVNDQTWEMLKSKFGEIAAYKFSLRNFKTGSANQTASSSV